MRRLVVLFGLAVLMLGLPGCGPPPKDPAVVAFDGLFRAFVGGDAERAYALLGPESREALAGGLGVDAADDASAIAERLAVRPGWTFAVDRTRRAKLDPARSTADRRIVVGPLAGRIWSVPVVKVGESWRVELVKARPEAEGNGSHGG